MESLEISLTYNHTNLSAKFDYIDPSIEDIFSAFEGMLISYGYPIDVINNYYLVKAEEINNSQNNQK